MEEEEVGTEYCILVNELIHSPESTYNPLFSLLKTATGNFHSDLTTWIHFYYYLLSVQLVTNSLSGLCVGNATSFFVELTLFLLRTVVRVLEYQKW
jgi:hypothetical protein